MGSTTIERACLVLVVDDYADAREMTSEYLRLCGYRVVAVATGRDAIDNARALQPDVILLDVVLPDLDGWEVISRLRASPDTSRLRIALHTACVTPDIRARARLVGIDLFFPKPCDVETLAAQLASAVAMTREAQV